MTHVSEQATNVPFWHNGSRDRTRTALVRSEQLTPALNSQAPLGINTMTKDVATDPDGGERKMSVPRICHEFEGEILNIPENKLLQRRRLLHADGQTNAGSHTRSCSFRDRPRPKLLNVDIDRPRRSSLPSPSANLLSVSFDDIHGRRSPEPLQRVRSFKTTSKGGIVNRGDSFKRSSNSVNSMGSGVASDSGAGRTSSSRQRINSAHSKDSSNAEDSTSSTTSSPAVYKVGMLGDKGVGKTALTSQFMTSEFVAFENDQDDVEETVRHVPVLLNSEESILEFTDKEMHNKELRDMDFDAFVVVYSITDKRSYQRAVDQIYLVRHELSYAEKPVLLIANKIDLVRKRKVSKEEGISIAKQYDCKYAETSAALNHHVDEVLVGILTQIRLKLTPGIHMEPPKFDSTRRRLSKTGMQALSGPKKFLQKIFKKNNYKAVSHECENLFT